MSGLPRPGEVYAGRYLIERQVGRGGAGLVYEAQDVRLDRPVAVKVVTPADDDDHRYAERFEREAQVLARIRSRHTVTIHEHGESDGTVFLVTDLMPDGDLHSWLLREGPMPWRGALSVTAQICEALEDTHRAGFVHRDVKPSNVLLWTRSTGLIAYLCDFGIAAAIDDAAERELTRVGSVVGSPAYMAPERLLGHGGDDERADVYAAGCVLWATLTGEAPYVGTDLDVMTQQVEGPIPQLGTGDRVDDQIDALLRKVLAKDPRERLATAADFRRELHSIHSVVAGAPSLSGLRPVPPSVSSARTAASSVGTIEAPEIDGPEIDGPEIGVTSPLGGTIGPGPDDELTRHEHEHVLPAPAAPTEKRSRRRGALVLLAAAVLVGAGLVARLASAEGDSAPTSAATSPVGGATTGPAPVDAGSPTAGTTAEELLAVTVAPRVRAASGYRSVRFAYRPPREVPGAEVRVEYYLDDAWVAAPRSLVRRTSAGGRTSCLRARSVVETTDGLVAESPARRFCGTAAAPTVRVVASTTPCSLLYRGYTYPCRWYSVELAGFVSGEKPVVELVPETGPSYCTEPVPGSTFRCRSARINGQGRATITDYVRIATTTELTVRVGATSKPVTLTGP